MLKNYFKNKNYIALYLNSIGNNIAGALFSFFSGTYLYSMGMPLHFVILFFGLEFGLRGVLSPLGPIFSRKFGIPTTMLISYISLSVFFFIISLASTSLFISFFSFIFISFAWGIECPIMNFIYSMVVDNKHRGKQFSLNIVIGAISRMFGIFIGAMLIDKVNFVWIAVFATIISLLTSIPFFIFLDDIHIPKISFIDPYKFLFSKEFRENLIPMTGYSLSIIANESIAPLFIFILVGSFKIFGFIFILSILAEKIFTLLFGHYIDKNGNKKSVILSSILLSIGLFTYMFIYNPLSAFLVSSYTQISKNMFFGSLETGLHKKMKNSKHSFIYSTAKEMSLCFSEVIYLPIFALIAYFFDKNIFAIVFLSGIFGLYLVRKFFRYS